MLARSARDGGRSASDRDGAHSRPELGDNQGHERAWSTVVPGRCTSRRDQASLREPGLCALFEPGERHSVASERGAQILLILVP
jgi:hypothetical protein